MAVDVGASLLDQLLCGLFALKGDEGKVLGLVVLALVHGADNLSHGAKSDEVSLNLLVGDALGGEVAEVDLALLGLGLLAGDLLALDHVGLLGGGPVDSCAVLEQDEGKTSGSTGIGICFQIDVLYLSELSKVLLDVCVFGLLKIFSLLNET